MPRDTMTKGRRNPPKGRNEVKWPTINKTEVSSRKGTRAIGSALNVAQVLPIFLSNRSRIRWIGSCVKIAIARNVIPSVTDVKTPRPSIGGAGFLCLDFRGVLSKMSNGLIVSAPVNRVRRGVFTAVSERITSRIFIRWFGAVNYF